MIFIAAILASTVGASRASDVHGATGYWLTENEKAIVQFKACGDAAAKMPKPRICGQIVWSENPRQPDGALKLDVENPDEDLRKRPLCGLPLIGGLSPASDQKLEDGWIYNPRSGDTYGAEAELVSAEKLKPVSYTHLTLPTIYSV